MSPTILRINGYRFFFFSREESRMHIHVMKEIMVSGLFIFLLPPAFASDCNANLTKI